MHNKHQYSYIDPQVYTCVHRAHIPGWACQHAGTHKFIHIHTQTHSHTCMCPHNPLRPSLGQRVSEAPMLWPPDAKSRLTEKDPDAGKD